MLRTEPGRRFDQVEAGVRAYPLGAVLVVGLTVSSLSLAVGLWAAVDDPYLVNLLSSLTGWGVGVPVTVFAVSRLIKLHNLRWWRQPAAVAQAQAKVSWRRVTAVLLPHLTPTRRRQRRRNRLLSSARLVEADGVRYLVLPPRENARIIEEDFIRPASEREDAAGVGFLGRLETWRDFRRLRRYLIQAEERPAYPRSVPRALTTPGARHDLTEATELVRGIASGPLGASPLGQIIGALVSDIVDGIDRLETMVADLPSELLEESETGWANEHPQVRAVVALAVAVLRSHGDLLRELHSFAPCGPVTSDAVPHFPLMGRYERDVQGMFVAPTFDLTTNSKAGDEEE